MGVGWGGQFLELLLTITSSVFTSWSKAADLREALSLVEARNAARRTRGELQHPELEISQDQAEDEVDLGMRDHGML